MSELVVYRISKVAYPVFDGMGAALEGGRWNSPGRAVVYGSEALSGSLLEILVHAGRLLKLPGRHHYARAFVPEDVAVEVVTGEEVAGWDEDPSPTAAAFGDRWYDERRTAILRVPAVSARPFGTHLLLNPTHPGFGRIRIEAPVPIEWDARLLTF
jgi:RES domain-containing protein